MFAKFWNHSGHDGTMQVEKLYPDRSLVHISSRGHAHNMHQFIVSFESGYISQYSNECSSGCCREEH